MGFIDLFWNRVVFVLEGAERNDSGNTTIAS